MEYNLNSVTVVPPKGKEANSTESWGSHFSQLTHLLPFLDFFGYVEQKKKQMGFRAANSSNFSFITSHVLIISTIQM